MLGRCRRCGVIDAVLCVWWWCCCWGQQWQKNSECFVLWCCPFSHLWKLHWSLGVNVPSFPFAFVSVLVLLWNMKQARGYFRLGSLPFLNIFAVRTGSRKTWTLQRTFITQQCGLSLNGLVFPRRSAPCHRGFEFSKIWKNTDKLGAQAESLFYSTLVCNVPELLCLQTGCFSSVELSGKPSSEAFATWPTFLRKLLQYWSGN